MQTYRFLQMCVRLAFIFYCTFQILYVSFSSKLFLMISEIIMVSEKWRNNKCRKINSISNQIVSKLKSNCNVLTAFGGKEYGN